MKNMVARGGMGVCGARRVGRVASPSVGRANCKVRGAEASLQRRQALGYFARVDSPYRLSSFTACDRADGSPLKTNAQ